MSHELSITVERDNQFFLESSVNPGKVLEGPFITVEEADARAKERSDEFQGDPADTTKAIKPTAKKPIPDRQEFLDAGLVLSDDDNELDVGTKLGAINIETDKAPSEVVADTLEDPSIRDDLLSDRRQFPRAYKVPEPPLPDPEAADDQPPGFLLDVGRGVLTGAAKAADEILEVTGLNNVAEFLEEKFPLGKFNIPAPETLPGEIAISVTQATVAMVPAARLLRAAGVTSSFLRWTAAGGVADFAAFAPDDPALGELAKDIGKLDNKTMEIVRKLFADALAKDADDSDVEKRLKSAAGGVLAGATLDGLMALYRGGRGIIKTAADKGLDPLLFSAVGLGAVLGELFGATEAKAGGASKIFQLLAKRMAQNRRIVPEITIGGRKINFGLARELSRAEKLPDAPFLVFDTRKEVDFEGVFPTAIEAERFISSHPEGKFFDFGTPREIEELNPSGEETIDFMMQEMERLVMQAGAANLPAVIAPIGLAVAEQITPEGQETQVAGLFEKLFRPLLKGTQRLTGKAAVLARISKGDEKPRRNLWNKFYRDIIDDLDPLNRAVKDVVGQKPGAVLAVADDPYKLARLNRGVNGKAEHFLEFSPFKFGTFENVGKSLKDILAPVNDQLDDVRAYAVAKRSLELRSRGIATGVDDKAAQATVAELEDKMEPVFRELVEYQDHVLNYLKDAGIVSEKAVALMREANKDYVPFFRLMDQPGGGALTRGMGVRQPVKRIKGSSRLIVDPLESIVKNTYLYLNLADRNGVGRALLELGESHPNGEAIAKVVAAPRQPTRVTGAEAIKANPEIQQILEQYASDAGVNIKVEDFSVFRPNSMVVGRNQIAVYRDGKRLLVEVDPEIADTFKALDAQSAGMLVKIMAVPARLLRAGAVLSPEFIARNPIRDQLSAFVFSEGGFIPFLDLSRGIFHMVKKDEVFQNWIKSGGPMASLVSLDRTYLQKNIRQIAEQTGLGERVLNVVKSPIEGLRVLSDLAERGTRLGEFAKVAGEAPGKEKILKGGFASREVTLDFQRIGAKTRSVNQLIAFFNANIQGQDKVIRSFKNNPLRTTAKIAAGITLPSVTLHAINRKFHDDPDDPNGYSKLPRWVRDIFWNVKVGDTWWRFPKPFELGIIFGTGAERMVDFIMDKDPKAFDGILKTMGRGAAPGFLPTALTAPIEAFANRSLFTERPIIPAGRERLLPEYQYSLYTTEAAKALGKLLAQIPVVGESRHISPAIMENYVRSWTGGLGTHILNLADLALRKTGVLPDPPTPATTLADIPFIKGFVVRHPTAGAEPIQKFFDEFDKQQSAQLTVKALIREGDADEAIKVMAQTVTEGQMIKLDGIKNALITSMKTVRAIWKNPMITADEKRQLIDAIYSQMIEMSMLGNEIVETGEAQAKEAVDLLQTTPTPIPEIQFTPLEVP